MFEEQDGEWVLLDYKTDKILSHFAEGEALYKEMAKAYWDAIKGKTEE